MFSKYQDYEQYLKEMLEFMCEKTYNNITVPDEHPDLVEDFFGMLTRYMRYLPSAVMTSRSLITNLKFAETTIGMNQADAAKCVYAFIEMLFKACSPTYLDEKLSEVPP